MHRAFPPGLLITVVARNSETVAALREYLTGAGVATSGQSQVANLATAVPQGCRVVIVFPDDFMFLAVAAELASLQATRPSLLTVLVTNDPRRYEALPLRDDAFEPVVIPKPAWGWTILETVRARMNGDPLS